MIVGHIAGGYLAARGLAAAGAGALFAGVLIGSVLSDVDMVLSFIFHWTFAVELALCAFALGLFVRTRRRVR